MNPGRDALIIILIILALGIITSSLKNGSGLFSNLGSGLIINSGTKGKSSINSSSKKELSDKQKTVEIEKAIRETKAEIALIASMIEEIEMYGEYSPYKNMITIQKNQSGPRSKDAKKEYIQLKVSKDAASGLVISKWKLESAVTGRNITIGKGVKLFFSGNSNSKENITVYEGDQIYIATGRSPIGSSFLENKCSGYYSQFQTFNPRLKKSCPKPADEILNYTVDTSIFIDNACMDFVEKMGVCKIQTNPLPLTLSSSCQEAIFDEINYNACIDNHKNDTDFYKNTWRVYLKRDLELWREKREIIKLLDENGKTVDYFSY